MNFSIFVKNILLRTILVTNIHSIVSGIPQKPAAEKSSAQEKKDAEIPFDQIEAQIRYYEEAKPVRIENSYDDDADEDEDTDNGKPEKEDDDEREEEEEDDDEKDKKRRRRKKEERIQPKRSARRRKRRV